MTEEKDVEKVGNNSLKDLESNKKHKPGVVYISRIPPTMAPHEVRRYLEPFGPIDHLYLMPDGRSKKTSGSKSTRRRNIRYTEGWVEFLRRKDAKNAALALNGTCLGGKKSSRLHDEMWNIKYLPDFQWSNLHEQVQYEKTIKEQRLRAEMSQARKVTAHFVQQAERAWKIDKIEETRRTRQAKKEGISTANLPPPPSTYERDMQQMELLSKRFKQRQPIKSSYLKLRKASP